MKRRRAFRFCLPVLLLLSFLAVGGCPDPREPVGQDIPGPQGPQGPAGPEGPMGPGQWIVVDAGGNKTVEGGDTVLLDGSATTVRAGAPFGLDDPAITWLWEQVDESSLTVPITDADKVEASFVAPSDEGLWLLEFRLTVTDPDGFAAWHELSVLVNNTGSALTEVVLVGTDTFSDFSATSGQFGLSVSVKDEDGDLITKGLSTANFRIGNCTLTPVGGTTQTAASTTVDSIVITPPSSGSGAITAVCAFDSSGSMSWNDPGAVGRKAGGKAFLNIMDGDDFVAFIDFGVGASGGLANSRLLQDFTDDKSLLEAALNELVEYGGTPLWESALDALDMLDNRMATGGVIVLLTDGEANTEFERPTVISRANARQTQIFTIGLGSGINFQELRDVAAATGGAFAEASDPSALAAAFQGIGTAATTGFITVEATATFAALAPGDYTLAGQLTTQVGSNSITTPFSMRVTVAAQ